MRNKNTKKMQQLNLPQYIFRIKNQNEKDFIFDEQRKKYVSLTPEEWVRQNFLRYLIEVKLYPASLLAVEQELKLNGMKKRCDAIVYNYNAEPIVIIEFKAPNIRINQKTFDQTAVYNSKLGVEYLIISNGLNHYFCKVDSVNSRYEFFPDIPNFNTLVS